MRFTIAHIVQYRIYITSPFNILNYLHYLLIVYSIFDALIFSRLLLVGSELALFSGDII